MSIKKKKLIYNYIRYSCIRSNIKVYIIEFILHMFPFITVPRASQGLTCYHRTYNCVFNHKIIMSIKCGICDIGSHCPID